MQLDHHWMDLRQDDRLWGKSDEGRREENERSSRRKSRTGKRRTGTFEDIPVSVVDRSKKETHAGSSVFIKPGSVSQSVVLAVVLT